MTGLALTSTDPDVIAVIERNREGRRALFDKAFAWGKERGFEEVMVSGHSGMTYVTGLPGKPEGFGDWTKPKSRNSHPMKSNKAEAALLDDLIHRGEPVPGLPETVHSVSDRDGTSYAMWPTPFVVDGVAFVGYSHRPEPNELAKIGTQWVECLPSAFYDADDQRRAASA